MQSLYYFIVSSINEKKKHLAKMLPIIPLLVRKNGDCFKIMLLNFVPGNQDTKYRKTLIQAVFVQLKARFCKANLSPKKGNFANTLFSRPKKKKSAFEVLTLK